MGEKIEVTKVDCSDFNKDEIAKITQLVRKNVIENEKGIIYERIFLRASIGYDFYFHEFPANCGKQDIDKICAELEKKGYKTEIEGVINGPHVHYFVKIRWD